MAFFAVKLKKKLDMDFSFLNSSPYMKYLLKGNLPHTQILRKIEYSRFYQRGEFQQLHKLNTVISYVSKLNIPADVKTGM